MSTLPNAGELYIKADEARQRKDHVAALALFKQAAEKGVAWAMIRIGQMYYEGNGVARDDNEALRWITKAGEAGDSDDDISYSLGDMYLRGEDLPRDYDQALRWLRKAAEEGVAWAMMDLGSMYERGEGVPRDLNEAIRWYLLATKRDKFGCGRLAQECVARCLGAS